jgi:hypothetical protein
MKAKQLYYLLVASLVIVLLAFAGIAYGTNKLLGHQASKLASQRATSESLSNQQTTLTKNKQDLVKYKELNDIAKSVVPQDKDQAEAVREIVHIASQSGITKLSSITFPSSTLGTKTSTKGGLTQLTPVKGISGVYNLQITITQDANSQVPYSQFLTFLRNLEQNRRTAQVSSITVSPNPTNLSMVSFTLVIDEYIKP